MIHNYSRQDHNSVIALLVSALYFSIAILLVMWEDMWSYCEKKQMHKSDLCDNGKFRSLFQLPALFEVVVWLTESLRKWANNGLWIGIKLCTIASLDF